MPGDVTVEHDGVAFRCRVDGTSGPWIAFSNSLVTDLSVWDAQVAVLADRFRILRYDQRGHGGTGTPEAPCDFHQLGGDLLALLDRFAVDHCTLVGLSMGVPTCLRVVELAPGRVDRLVLSDGQAATAAAGAAAWQERIDFARARGMAAVADATVARWFAPDFVTSGAAERIRAVIAATPLAGYVACARALQDFDFAHVLPAIRVPALLVAGASDGAIPATMARMCGAIAGARFIEIPSAGHVPNVEQAEAFNRALLAFLEPA